MKLPAQRRATDKKSIGVMIAYAGVWIIRLAVRSRFHIPLTDPPSGLHVGRRYAVIHSEKSAPRSPQTCNGNVIHQLQQQGSASRPSEPVTHWTHRNLALSMMDCVPNSTVHYTSKSNSASLYPTIEYQKHYLLHDVIYMLSSPVCFSPTVWSELTSHKITHCYSSVTKRDQ